MSQWYLSYDGRQTGPMDQSGAAKQARANPDGYAWREGFTDWVPISKIAELSSTPMAMPGAPAPPQLGGSRSRADEIDFKICGAEMQFVEVELDPPKRNRPQRIVLTLARLLDTTDIRVCCASSPVFATQSESIVPYSCSLSLVIPVTASAAAPRTPVHSLQPTSAP